MRGDRAGNVGDDVVRCLAVAEPILSQADAGAVVVVVADAAANVVQQGGKVDGFFRKIAVVF